MVSTLLKFEIPAFFLDVIAFFPAITWDVYIFPVCTMKAGINSSFNSNKRYHSIAVKNLKNIDDDNGNFKSTNEWKWKRVG